MFKILILNSDAPAALDKLQAQYDIMDVHLLGFDTDNKYLLVQYGTKSPPQLPPTSGSAPSGSNA